MRHQRIPCEPATAEPVSSKPSSQLAAAPPDASQPSSEFASQPAVCRSRASRPSAEPSFSVFAAPSPALAPVWTYQGTFVDLTGGVYLMPQSANKQRNNAYYYNASGSSSPALQYPATVASCQAWGAANGLNVIGLEYSGECYGCAGCNYAVDGVVSPNCTIDIGCSYNLQVYTLSAPLTRGLNLGDGDSSNTAAPASSAGLSSASLSPAPVSSSPRLLWITLATVGTATVAAAAAVGARVYSRRRAARAGGDATGDSFKRGKISSPTKIPFTEVPSRLTGVDV